MKEGSWTEIEKAVFLKHHRELLSHDGLLLSEVADKPSSHWKLYKHLSGDQF